MRLTGLGIKETTLALRLGGNSLMRLTLLTKANPKLKLLKVILDLG